MSEPCLASHPDGPTPADVGQLCYDHHAQLRRLLTELPAVADWLTVNIAAGGGNDTDRPHVTGSRDDPIPLRLDVLDLIGPDSPQPVHTQGVTMWDQRGVDALRATVRYYVRTVHEQTGAPYPPVAVLVADDRAAAEFGDLEAADETCRALRWDRRRDTNPARWTVRLAPARDGWPDYAPLSQTVTYLAGHLSWIAGQDWVAAMLSELRQAHTDAHRLAPWREQIVRDDTPCVCGKRAVIVHVAAGESRCEPKAGGCGARRALSDYQLTALLPATRRAS